MLNLKVKKLKLVGKLSIGGQLYTGPIPNKDPKTQHPRINIQKSQNFNLPPPLGKEHKRRKDIPLIQDNSSWNSIVGLPVWRKVLN